MKLLQNSTESFKQASAKNALVNTEKPAEEPKTETKPISLLGGGNNNAVTALKEKMELKMKLALTQKMLDKTMNEYKYLKDETLRKEQL